eukprot:g31951.t1
MFRHISNKPRAFLGESCKVDFQEKEISVSFPLPGSSEEEYQLNLDLCDDIVPGASKIEVSKVKVEVILQKKTAGVKWKDLERKEELPEIPPDQPAYPTSNKSKRNWQQIDREIEEGVMVVAPRDGPRDQHSSTKERARQDEDQHVLWETLVPRYCSSTVPALELRRENLAIALAGQLSVFFCRFLTGHWGASGVGLLVFVVGNNARCSLQVSELTCYLALAGGAGMLDVLDLIQHVVTGAIMVHLPFVDHLALNLEATKKTVVGRGIRRHHRSGIPRSMMDPRQSMMFYPNPHRFHSLPIRPSDPMRTRMPPTEGGGAGWDVASMIPGWPWPDVRAYMPDFGQAGQVDALASSSQDLPHAMKRRNAVDVACAECGCTIRAGQGRCGTGDFFGSVYCSNCWNVWGSSQSA